MAILQVACKAAARVAEFNALIRASVGDKRALFLAASAGGQRFDALRRSYSCGVVARGFSWVFPYRSN